MQIEAALAYARKHALQACLVLRHGEPIAEVYDNGFAPGAVHPLFSGTKGFWGPVALRAREDGLLELDERVCDTIEEWKNDASKQRITVRMLLSLSAGFPFGGLGAAVPTYDRAIATPLKDEPGTTFTYGGIPLQIFGALLARKLAEHKLTPHQYLEQRMLGPAEVTVASWRQLKDGTQPLPTGAFLTTDNWLSYGRFILTNRDELAECFQGSQANPRYGLGWWLAPKGAPTDLIYASGSGSQALYIIPSLDLVVVHFGSSASYKHEAFLRQLVLA